MAKNVTLLGASYSDVPAVELPQTGGGTATFTDVSVTTATASDVMEGTYFFNAQGQYVEGELTSGGGRVIIRDTTDAHGGTIRTITSDEELYIDSLSVTNNGTYNAPSGTAYDSVSVSVSGSSTYTATITNTGSSSVYVKYPGSTGTTYYTSGNTFTFSEGDSLYLYSSQGDSNYIRINGTNVAGGSHQTASYTYTLPAKNIEIYLQSSVSVSYCNIVVSYQTLSITENGTYDVEDYDFANVNVSDAVEDAVRFFDYDGTILHSYTAAEFLALSAMPANPSHTGLVAQGWNWTLADAQAHVEDWECLDIGQMYTTSSGNTEIDIRLRTGRLNPYLGLAVNGTVSIDWGDNSTPSTVTGTSLTTQIRTPHTYSTAGRYTISISITSGSFAFYNTTTYYLLSGNFSSNNNNRVYADSIEAVRIGDGNITIGNYAFFNCEVIKYVTIPQSTLFVSSASQSFSYCRGLRFLCLPKGSSTYASGSSWYTYNFRLRSVSFSNKVTSISGSSFSSCYSMDSIVLTNNISNYASNLYDQVTQSHLKRLIWPVKNIKQTNNNEYIADFTGLTTIQNAMFASTPSLRSATIPSTVTSIGAYAFSACYDLREITLPTTGLTIGNYVFQNCWELNSVVNLDKATSIGIGAFATCYSLTGPIAFKSSLESLGTYLFQNCQALTDVTLPSSLKSVPDYCFQACGSLQEVTIPSSVTSIGSYSFYGCWALASITIPSLVTSIGNYAFNNCYGLGEMHVKPTSPPTIGGTNALTNIPTDCVIYVPAGYLSAYQTANYWSARASQMVEE